ncbi:MAG: hypothetical protein ACI4PI_01350 [Oscillospiraceae bacterium]
MEINFNVEKDMKPPIISEDQKGVQEALARFTDNQELKLIYPKSGENVMPFIRRSTKDKDKNTVFVFYSVTNNNKTTTKIAMLKKNSNIWNVISSVVVSNRYNCEIEDVSFRRMRKLGNDNLIVGVGTQGQRTKEVFVYEYTDTKLREIEDMNHSYAAKILTDIDDDGFDELILIDRPVNAEPSIIMIKLCETSQLEYTISSCYAPLKESPNIVKDAKLTVGKLKNNNKAIFIDEIVYDESQEKEIRATELVEYVDKYGLVNRTLKTEKNLGDTNFDLSYLTQRGKNVELVDIDGDGCLEIPCERPITEFLNSGEENLKEIDWYSFYGDNVKLSAIEIMDIWAQYRLKLKLDWFAIKHEKLSNTDVKVEGRTLQVNGYYKPESNGHMLVLEKENEKIVIYVVPKGKKVKDIFSKFATSGELDYYVSIPNESEEEQAISMREFQKLFKLLN